MEFRRPNPADSNRIREVVRSAMTSSFELSPQQIDGIVASEFDDDRLTGRASSENAVVGVVDVESGTTDAATTVVGCFVGDVEGDWGSVRWLFVDPEYRGRNVGTLLFESGVEQLRQRGARRLRAFGPVASGDGHQFYEQFGLEQTDEREVDVGDETFWEYVYTETDGPE